MSKMSAFIKLGKLFWKNSDQIIKLFDLLMNQLPVVGKALEDAGKMAVVSSQILKSNDHSIPGISELLAATSSDMAAISQKIIEAKGKLSQFNTNITALSIPFVTIENKDYGIPIVGGHITVPTPALNNVTPFSGFKANLDDAVSAFDEATKSVEFAEHKVSALSNSISNASENLNKLGQDLTEAGRLFKEFGGN